MFKLDFIFISKLQKQINYFLLKNLLYNPFILYKKIKKSIIFLIYKIKNLKKHNLFIQS